ncbi:protein NRT1/ PTR FAMILY 5.8-like [Aristolochia californica]|uniref:protein NRT1/ PTR FAMILY 5.8-like n=1 Tax=Aristolochia californica TaxID=171875 RepID=UPI0035DBAB8B
MAGGTESGGLSRSCILIIVVASVERFAYKGVASNLVTYLTDVAKLNTSSAAKNVNSWCGVTSMLPLLGAFLADSYWDRYSTILVSSLLYIVGLASLTVSALLWAFTPINKTIFEAALFSSLYLISMAQGGYNPCLQAFGADQLEKEDQHLPCSRKENENIEKKSKFFQWWYFGICSGSLMGVTLMSYIQDNFGWGWGFAIPTIGMALSAICFSCGTHLYVRKKTKVTEQPTEAMVHSIKETVKKAVRGRIRLSPKEEEVAELELQDKPLIDAFPTTESSFDEGVNKEEPRLIDARVILKLLPVWTMLLMFAVIFQQPATFFTKQGMAMKRNIGNNFMIPPATLQSAITISIILLMPLYDKAIIPALRMITGNEKGINVLQRMGIGMLLSVVAMVVAALVETKRIDMSRKGEAVPLSIFWLLPQYILLGVSDVFTVVGMQEFFYTQVPTRMRSIGIGLYLSVFGVGSFLSALLITVIELITTSGGNECSWFSDDMREARLDNYYWLLALSGSICLMSFISLCKHCTNESCK